MFNLVSDRQEVATPNRSRYRNRRRFHRALPGATAALVAIGLFGLVSTASADFFYRLNTEIDERALASVVGSDNCLPEVDSASQKAVLPVTQELIDEFQEYWDGGGLVELRYSVHAAGSTGGQGQARHTVEVFFGLEKADGTRNLWDAPSSTRRSVRSASRTLPGR